MKYVVRIGENEHTVVIDGESVSCDGTTVRAHLEEVEGTPLQMLRVGDAVYRVYAKRSGARGTYDLSVAGHRFAVEALDERTRAIRELSGASAKPAGSANVIAPMPGLIVRINVKEGDTVRAGTGLVVMEAMKMENELRAPANGVVKRIVVTPGNAVEKGALVLELEREA